MFTIILMGLVVFTIILMGLVVQILFDYDLMDVTLLHMFKGNSNLTIEYCEIDCLNPKCHLNPQVVQRFFIHQTWTRRNAWSKLLVLIRNYSHEKYETFGKTPFTS